LQFSGQVDHTGPVADHPRKWPILFRPNHGNKKAFISQ
jgi:hypothetical protein